MGSDPYMFLMETIMEESSFWNGAVDNQLSLVGS